MFRSKKPTDIKTKLEAYKTKKAKSALISDTHGAPGAKIPSSRTTDGQKYLLATWLQNKLNKLRDVQEIKKALYVAHRVNEKIENEKVDPSLDIYYDTATGTTFSVDSLCERMLLTLRRYLIH